MTMIEAYHIKFDQQPSNAHPVKDQLDLLNFKNTTGIAAIPLMSLHGAHAIVGNALSTRHLFTAISYITLWLKQGTHLHGLHGAVFENLLDYFIVVVGAEF